MLNKSTNLFLSCATVLVACVLAVLSFGKAGLIGAVLSALTLLGAGVMVIDVAKSQFTVYKEERNALASQQALLASAEKAKEEAMIEFIVNPTEEKKKAYVSAIAEVQAQRNAIDKAKKRH